MITLTEFLAEIEERKLRLGLVETPEQTAALRNSGEQRTPEKRELLRRIDARARAAGLTPVISNY